MICRLCLIETEFCLPLKNAENQEKDEKREDIAEIIRKHFDLELNINSDLVCTVCWQQISEFHTFYLFIEEKQKEFRQQSTLSAITGTRNDSTDNEHEVVIKKEVAAQDGNDIDIKHECLMDINTPVIAENSLKQWAEEKEFIDEVYIEAPNPETSATSTENASETESETDMTDEDDDEVDIKNGFLIEIGNPMITENSQWNQEATPQTVSKNLEDIRNAQFIDQVENEPVSCETNTNDIDKTARIQQTKVTPPEEKKKVLDKKIRLNKNYLIIAKHAGILKCELCAQTMETFGNLRQHFKKEHDRRGYITCCYKRYYRQHLYAEHLEWHSNPNLWKCEPCNLVHSCRDSYDRHLLLVHPEEESSEFQCTFCPARFSQGYSLRRHIKNQHREKTFKCDECNKKFVKFDGLAYHKKTVHLRAYQAECDICGKTFANSWCCRRHKAQVHQVKVNLRAHPRECDICGKGFANTATWKTHKAKIHQVEENLRVYTTEYFQNLHPFKKKCDICGKSFANSFSCKRHKAQVHQVEEN